MFSPNSGLTNCRRVTVYCNYAVPGLSLRIVTNLGFQGSLTLFGDRIKKIKSKMLFLNKYSMMYSYP